MVNHTPSIPNADNPMYCMAGVKFDTSLINGVINSGMIISRLLR
jgi:hypothetical protein